MLNYRIGLHFAKVEKALVGAASKANAAAVEGGSPEVVVEDIAVLENADADDCQEGKSLDFCCPIILPLQA